MSSQFNESLSIDWFEGVMLGSLSDYRPDRPRKIHEISDGQQTLRVMVPNADMAHTLLSNPILTHRFQLLGTCTDNEAPAIITDIELIDEGQALWQLPPSLCPVIDVLSSTIDLIAGIQTLPLREFVMRVFVDRAVCRHYWTMPASARHHHAWPGGLATHSLEVAMDLATQSQLDNTECDLAVAGGLLHDIGKVWSYTPDMFQNRAARAMGHELIGLSKLEHEIRILEDDWPDGAYAMRVLLSGCGRMRPDGSMPSSLLARIKAADQRSCEQERSTHAPRQWRPSGWQDAPANH
ncbi:MAG: HD domain-containing protein [Pseudoxanthomonas sp.]